MGGKLTRRFLVRPWLRSRRSVVFETFLTGLLKLKIPLVAGVSLPRQSLNRLHGDIFEFLCGAPRLFQSLLDLVRGKFQVGQKFFVGAVLAIGRLLWRHRQDFFKESLEGRLLIYGLSASSEVGVSPSRQSGRSDASRSWSDRAAVRLIPIHGRTIMTLR